MNSTCCKCGEDLAYVASSNMTPCDTCRYLLFPLECGRPPGVLALDYTAKQKAELIPHVLPVEKWPEIRYDLPRGASRYAKTIKYFKAVETWAAAFGARYRHAA